MEYKYKFTVVMPVYNVEDFIDQAVQSVITQEIGIENIQLLLIDDGSLDNSGNICDRFAAQYPDNIFAVHKSNGGLSSARNAGLDLTEGKYVTFTDPDDILQANALGEVWNFFENHYDETDITAIKLVYFEGRTGDHYLNYKFLNGSRVVDLKEEWDCPQMSVASAFIKTAAIGDLRFDDRLSFAEDGLFSQTIIMEKQTLGLVDTTQYNYRVRTNGSNSLLQGSANNPKWYIPTLKYYHVHLINEALRRLGSVPKYLQMVLMYELQWRIKRPELSTGVISREEEQEYYRLICEIIRYIDDDVIAAQKYIWRDVKLFLLYLKYGHAPDYIAKDKEIIISFSPASGFRLSKTSVFLDFAKLKNRRLYLEGYILVPAFGERNLALKILINGEPVKFIELKKDFCDICLQNNIQYNYGFGVSMHLKEKCSKYTVEFVLSSGEAQATLKHQVFKEKNGFDWKAVKTYMQTKGWQLSDNGKGAVEITRCGRPRKKLAFLRKIARKVVHKFKRI